MEFTTLCVSQMSHVPNTVSTPTSDQVIVLSTLSLSTRLFHEWITTVEVRGLEWLTLPVHCAYVMFPLWVTSACDVTWRCAASTSCVTSWGTPSSRLKRFSMNFVLTTPSSLSTRSASLLSFLWSVYLPTDIHGVSINKVKNTRCNYYLPPIVYVYKKIVLCVYVFAAVCSCVVCVTKWRHNMTSIIVIIIYVYFMLIYNMK